jgi:hypothetical protein
MPGKVEALQLWTRSCRWTSIYICTERCDTMDHLGELLLEPFVALFAIFAETLGVCVDGCLQGVRESCHCIPGSCGSNGGDNDETRPILEHTTQPQPTPAPAPRWSSVQTLRGSR